MSAENPRGKGSADGSTDADDKEFSEPLYKDPDWLFQKYHVEGLTQRQMSDIVDMNNGTISYWMDKHDIESPDAATAKRLVPPKLTTRKDGYVQIGGKRSKHTGAFIHPLIAILDGADPHEVYRDDMLVHHKNRVKWDNRPENLEVKSFSEHAQEHHEDGDFVTSGLMYQDQ